jgi:hypothetical protein
MGSDDYVICAEHVFGHVLLPGQSISSGRVGRVAPQWVLERADCRTGLALSAPDEQIPSGSQNGSGKKQVRRLARFCALDPMADPSEEGRVPP